MLYNFLYPQAQDIEEQSRLYYYLIGFICDVPDAGIQLKKDFTYVEQSNENIT